MKLKRTGIFSIASTAVLCAFAGAQNMNVSQVATGGDFAEEGTSGGVAAFSAATTSCNPGNVVVLWNDGIGQAPVIATNMYRVANGRFEQLGYGWLKYSFCAVSEPSCGSCQATSCDTLGVGCADTYGSGLNDGANGGGAKWQIPPTTGGWVFPGPRITSSGSLPLRGRINTPISKLTEAGSRTFVEAHYISEHDHMAGNARDNATWRELNVVSAGNVSVNGPNQVGDPAIFAWQDVDPDVTIREVVVLNEGGSGVHGYHFLGYNATQIDATHWRYEYAVHNFNSDRAMGAFEIPLDGCDTAPVITDLFYNKVPHHSGDLRDSTDWNVTISASSIRWEAPETFAQNNLGNANWWDETLSVGFTADKAPAMVQGSIVPWKPGGTTLVATIEGPCGGPICGVESFCTSAPNSSGPGASIGVGGSSSIAANNFKLTAAGATPNAFGIFYYGPSEVQVPFGDGFRCVGGMTQRLQGPVQANGSGNAARNVNFTLPPVNAGSGAISPGDTVSFQFWYRDVPAGGSGFNLSNGASVTFCP